MNHQFKPRFLQVLVGAFANGPLTPLELNNIFLRDVPNKQISIRTLKTFLGIAMRGGLVDFDHNVYYLKEGAPVDLVRKCLHELSLPNFCDDKMFRYRCSNYLDYGYLSPQGEYTSFSILAKSMDFSSVEWFRLVSGSDDIRYLTGKESKHVESESLMFYGKGCVTPVSDDPDIIPRIEKRLLPKLPTSQATFLTGLQGLRRSWKVQVNSFLGRITVEELSSFIAYAKDMLDLIIWGEVTPLRSTVSSEHLSVVCDRFRKYGIRAKNLSSALRNLQSTYLLISRLSLGTRFLSNNLAHPKPPTPDDSSFSRVCNMPNKLQSSISLSRSGKKLTTLTRPLQLIHRALVDWSSKVELEQNFKNCSAAVYNDHLDDRLQKRILAERIHQLRLVSPTYLLDSLGNDLNPPSIPLIKDEVLRTASIISCYSNFIESTPGRAYGELRLALHGELDFRNRFNVHSINPEERYVGIWRNSLEELVERIENIRCSEKN
ncbi:hypothetical protein OAH08_04640 [Verrucomicrobia bacterium]|nr:hypothetical protein [Verrucomicrobiota bacterium]